MTSLYERFCKRGITPQIQPTNDENPTHSQDQELCRDDEALLSGRLAYRLNTPYGHVWLVADGQAKNKLQADGVLEAIYTIQEAQEFIKLPERQRAYVHTWKAGLNGTIETVKIEVHDKPGRFEVLSVDAKGQALETRTVTKDLFKYRVVRPLELHGKSYRPGDVIEATVDDSYWLLQDGSVQATCYWSRSDDFSSEGYR